MVQSTITEPLLSFKLTSSVVMLGILRTTSIMTALSTSSHNSVSALSLSKSKFKVTLNSRGGDSSSARDTCCTIWSIKKGSTRGEQQKSDETSMGFVTSEAAPSMTAVAASAAASAAASSTPSATSGKLSCATSKQTLSAIGDTGCAFGATSTP